MAASNRSLAGLQNFPLAFEKTLGGLARLAKAFPDLSIVVDHCGGAVGPAAFGSDPEALAGWKRLMYSQASSSLFSGLRKSPKENSVARTAKSLRTRLRT